MAVQCVQYMDLRLAIDTNPPTYDFIKYQEEVLERQQELLAAELEAQQAAEQADKIRQELFDLQLRGTPDVRAAADSLDGAEGDDGTPRDDSRLESRPSTKDTKSSRSTAGKGPSRVTTQVKVTAKPTKEAKSKPHKETADTAVQDEGGDPNAAHVETRQSKRTRSTLETVKESELTGDYENTFDLTDEDSWSAVPSEHIPGRFIQYRKLTQKKLLDLEDQLNLTVAKTQRKVHTLKSQFQEHKGKWEAERKVLIEQVEQAQKLQTEAEKEADVAMTQLEEFINEQERLEEEEEVKRQEVVRSVDGVNEKLPNATNVHDIATQVDSQRGSSPQTVTPVEGLIEGQREPLTTREPTTEQVDTVPEAAPQHVQTEDSEQELSKLMQQTDDAKFERQRSDIKIVSRRSSSMGSEVAPWLLHGEGPTAKSGADSMSDQEESAKSTPAMKPSISKSSFHTRSDKIQSEMSKLEDPDEAENENEDDGEKAPVRKSSVVMTTDDTKFMESSTSFGSVALKHDRKSVASKHSRLTLTSSCSDAGEVIDTEQADDDDQDEGQGSRSSTVILEDLEERPRSLPQDDSETEKSSRSRRSSPTGTEKKTIRSSRSHKSSRVEFTQSRSNERSPLEREGSVTVPASSMSRKSSLMGSSVVAQHNKESSFRSSASIVPVESRASLQGSPAVPEETRTSIQGSSPVLPATRSPLERASSVELSESRTGSIHGISRKGTRVSRRSSPGRVTSDPTFTTEETEDEPYFSVEITQHSRSHPKLTQQKQRSSDVMSERSSSSGQGQTDQRSSGQAQEINSRITSGAMSAPPAVEETSRSGSGMKDKYGNRVRSPRLRSISRSSAVSQHIARMSNAAPIEEISEVGSRSGRLSRSQSHSGGSYHKEAWLTPRLTARADDKGKGENELALDLADGLPISQASAVHNVKEMMEEVNLSSMQQRTLETVRSAIKCVNNNKDLSDIQLERTITLISLASQLTEESLHLGILPDSIFDAFADINSRDMSTMSHGDDDYDIEETHYLPADFLRPFTRGSLLTHEELSTAGARFLPEFSQASLKSLPPLDSLVWSPRSQRLIGRRKSQDPSAQKTCSAPLEKLAKHLDMKSHDLLPFDRIQSKKVNPFTTSHATKGSALKDTLSTSMSQESVEYLSRSRRLSKFGKRSPDFIDEGYDDAEIYIYRGNQVCDRGSSPAILVQINISGKTEEEIRTSSALSRASLRNQYRNKLGEVRAAVEDRRAKSPAISLPSQRSLEDDQLVDDDDDDMPFTDEVKELKVKEYSMDIGTSPPPGALKDQKQVAKGSRASSVVNSDHPVVGEYLKAYEGVIHFRNALSKLMLDREMLQPSQILADIDTVKFDQDTNVEPQLEKMTDNLYHVLEEVIGVLGAILLADREPMVSSLTGGLLMSRDGTQNYPHPDRVSADSGRGPTVTRASQHSSKTTPYSATSDKMALRELQEQYERLKIQFTEEGRKHEEQLRHNTVVMMEMQDTINELQRELTNLGRSSSRLRPNSDIASPQDSAIMFTRLDSERNAKIMKRAVNDQKMDSEKYKDAINKMDDYVSLPAQRLAHLVRKYVHHCRMKEIEENVKRSRSLNENVFEILDKMEALQNQRAKKWADRMDEMGAERLRLANLLMETLDSIEQESGIFLIKPMYSYRGRDVKDTRYGGKLTRPLRPQRHVSPNRELHSVFAPAPTPASNVRSLVKHAPLQAHYQQPVPPEQLAVKSGPVQPLEGDETGVTGASMNWVGTAAARQTWSLNSSVVRGDSEAGLANHMNTPRILELDINRMLIGQNTISSKMSQQGITEDRLVNASQNNLRSYITVNRPTASPSQPRQPSMTFFSSTTKEFVPPSSPASTANTTKRVRMSDVDIPRNIPSTPPLPPIPTGSAGSTHETLGEPPRSPPGSSLRQTPPHVQEVISPLK